MDVKEEYISLINKLATGNAEFSKAEQETLAVIAYKQPAIQSDVIKTRGNKSYDHIKKLKEEGFLISEKFGRTKILKLTQKFYDYFDVIEDELKDRLVIEEKDKQEIFDDSPQ